MLQLLMFLVTIFPPTESVAQVQDWHREVVVRANYGDNQDEYGYAGIVKKNEEEAIGPVSAFYVGDRNIWIEDYYQGNIKEYDLSGRFLRAITLEQPPPLKVNSTYIAIRGPHNVSDLLIYNGVIYLLCEGGGVPPPGQANVSVRAYNLDTGKKIETINIYNSTIARHDGEGAAAENAASFAMGQSGTILIYDGANGVSIPIIRDGKDVPAVEHTRSVPGLALGSRRVLFNEETRRVELVNSDGSFIRNLGFLDSLDNMIALGYGPKNGEYFVRCKAFKADFTVSTWDGRDIGRVTWEVKKHWWTYPIEDLIQIGPDGAFYYVYPDYDAIYVYRWSK